LRGASRTIHRAADDVRSIAVRRTLTDLSNADYSLEQKAEIKMAKRRAGAYTFR
jgi:hypothetical protein